MTDDQRKMLTEWMGGCWHEITSNIADGRIGHGYCKKCDMTFMGQGAHLAFYNPNDFFRTFTTWEDLGDVKEKLVEKGRWRAFSTFARKTFDPYHKDAEELFTCWLFRPSVDSKPHFCRLVAEFLQSGS